MDISFVFFFFFFYKKGCSVYNHPEYGKTGKCVPLSECSGSNHVGLRGYCDDSPTADYTCCYDKTQPEQSSLLRSCGLSMNRGKGVCVEASECPNNDSINSSTECGGGGGGGIAQVCCYSLQNNVDYYELRAVWISTVANIDWPSKPTLTTAQQQTELKQILNAIKEAGLNSCVFQIRPSGDALYASNIEPWSYYLTGILYSIIKLYTIQSIQYKPI